MTAPAASRPPDPTYRHVLVPLDGSDLAAGAVPAARRLAERFGAEIHTISVAESAAGADSLHRHAAEVLGVDPSDARVHVAVADDPAGAIRQQVDALGSCLVCMATHGRGRVVGALIGSVARSLLERGREPMIAVGPSGARPDPDRPITAPLGADVLIACVDGSDASERVLPVASAWVHALGMVLTIITVAEPSPPPLRADATWHRHHGPQMDADEYMRRLGERWSEVAPAVRTEVVYNPVSAADGLADYLESHPTGLLAVTTHARTGLDRVVFGAGAAGIVHASTAPVLVVPLGE